EAGALALEERAGVRMHDRDPVEDRVLVAAVFVGAAEDPVADVVAPVVEGAEDARDLERVEVPVVAFLPAAGEADEREAAGEVAQHGARIPVILAACSARSAGWRTRRRASPPVSRPRWPRAPRPRGASSPRAGGSTATRRAPTASCRGRS